MSEAVKDSGKSETLKSRTVNAGYKNICFTGRCCVEHLYWYILVDFYILKIVTWYYLKKSYLCCHVHLSICCYKLISLFHSLNPSLIECIVCQFHKFNKQSSIKGYGGWCFHLFHESELGIRLACMCSWICSPIVLSTMAM